IYEPWTQNLYTYCNNNPVNYVDPTGHMTVKEGWDNFKKGGAMFGNKVVEMGQTTYNYLKPNEIDAIYFQAGGFYGAETGAAGYVLGRVAGKDVAESIGKKVFGETVENAGRSAGRMTAKQASEAAKKLGFEKTKYTSHGQPVFKKGKTYITPDVDSHIGGVWKAAGSVEGLSKKSTRWGSYDADLKRIGD
ncbi:toxin C-terminal domain-containing protein, partial [Desulfocucumis palustris]|uniref:toxin C-terminal domain-containing protein n=1 Tax=Desulfocucumis palustris TaxID=1898651 RepID=UPI001A9A51DD